MSTTIAIQGDQASFHDIAAAQFFSAESTRTFCDTFPATFAALANGDADYALCAVENSLYGSINEVYDLLLAHDFRIIGEVYLRIEQCLIGMPGTRLTDIVEVHSHPVALAQCEAFLDESMPTATRMEYHDTAASVAMVAKLQDPSIAAIASREAAALYGMEVLASSIETDSQNYTRFVALSKQGDIPEAIATKTSLIVRTTHTPGALYNALGCFANRNISLTKLQSRPVIGDAWKYIFYIDVAAGEQTPECQQALAELRAQGCQVTVLGSYESGLAA
jgi:prephenate dehydratase